MFENLNLDFFKNNIIILVMFVVIIILTYFMYKHYTSVNDELNKLKILNNTPSDLPDKININAENIDKVGQRLNQLTSYVVNTIKPQPQTHPQSHPQPQTQPHPQLHSQNGVESNDDVIMDD